MVPNIHLLSLNVMDIIYSHHKGETNCMAQFVIEFDWVRDPKGYRLVEKAEQPRLRIVRNGKGCRPKDFEPNRPLETDVLFKIFASTVVTPAGALNFVQRFGPLTYEGRDPKAGDPVDVVMSNANHMQQVLKSAAGYPAPPNLLPVPFQSGQSVSLDAMVIWDPATNSPKWELRPKSLLDALWLQLGQALAVGAKIRQCEHCGDWFEAGRGTGRRLDAKFCSDEHRVLYNSLKRSREK